ncbi:MAG: serine hydrolase, partial [Pyrinomonadaceae bacterium]
MDIPTEFPTPPLVPPSTPAPKLDLKPYIELDNKFSKIAAETKGKIGIAAVVLETGESASVNADQHFPMQSVYKMPIAMAVMDQVRQGKLELDEKIGVTTDDMVREGQRSPLRDVSPKGGEFSIRELMKYALVESDGTASDVLMRVAGGAGEIQAFVEQLGVHDVKILNTEKEIGKDWQTQYQNWATPAAAVEMLRWLHGASDCGCSAIDPMTKSEEELTGQTFVLKLMADSNPGTNRLKGLLPKDTRVAHKTGTSGTEKGITAATN